jgi:hypothetical protein
METLLIVLLVVFFCSVVAAGGTLVTTEISAFWLSSILHNPECRDETWRRYSLSRRDLDQGVIRFALILPRQVRS